MTGGGAGGPCGRGRPRAGRDGRLKVAFAAGGPRGRTVAERVSARVPLAAQRVMYCDGPASPMAYLYVASVAGGMLQGDRYEVDIAAGPRSMAHVTTQGATRVYGMDPGGLAAQDVRVSVADGAYLEMVPDQIIPYGGSRFRQRVRLDVHDGATMVGSEVVAAGRAAMGEAFEYGECDLATEAFGCGGRRRFSDAARLEPSRLDLSAPGSMGGHAVFGTAYVMTPRPNVGALLEEVGSAASGRGGVVGGCSVMRDGSGIFVRMLGARAGDVRAAVLDIVAAARARCAGEPFAGIRKG